MPGPLRRPGVLLTCLLGVSLSCGGDGPGGVDPDGLVESVSISPSAAEVALGGTLQLGASVLNRSGQVVAAAVTWSSSDSAVAAVDQGGVVSALSPGSATIRASAGGRSGTASVVAFDPSPPSAPTDVRATPQSDAAVEVTWTDASGTETGFVVRREAVPPAGSGPVGSGPAAAVFVQAGTVGPDVTRFIDEGVAPGTRYRYAVEACNDFGCSERAPAADEVVTFQTLVVETSSTLPTARRGEAYDIQLVATGPPATWTLVAGALPDGLELASEGRLAGTPTEGGEFSATVMVQGGGQMLTSTFALTVLVPPAPAGGPLTRGIRGTAYEALLEATGGDGSYAWTLAGGSLPPGLTLEPSGRLAGIPTVSGTFAFQLRATSAGLEGTADRELRIVDPLVLTTTTLPAGIIDQAYDATLTAQGGDAPRTWSGSGLPPGLTLAGDGTIAGTPGQTGTFPVAVEVTSGDGQRASATLDLVVGEQPVPPVVVTATLPDGGVGAAYSVALAAVNGDGSYSWAVVGGALPSGLSLSTSGLLSGVPSAAGDASFTVRVSSWGLTGDATLDLRIHPALGITPASVPSAVRDAAYDVSLGITGGDGSGTFSLVQGSLPTGLTLAADGRIAGTPGSEGTFPFRVRAENDVGQVAERAFSLVVNAPLGLSGGSLPGGVAGQPYSTALTATGGDGSYAWSLSSGALPAGLSLGPTTGVISGTPAATGSSGFTVAVQSGDGQATTAAYTLVVAPPPPTVTTTSLPGGVVGAAYSATLTATGGNGSYAWEVVSGALPDGLALAGGSGAITGTPTSAGTFAFTVQVTSDGQTATRPLSIDVAGAAVSFARSFLPGAYPGVAYSAAVAPATGGTGSFTYAVTDGALPAGLSLDAGTGTVTGVPTTPGMAFFRITATSGAAEASVIFSITVSTAGPGAFNVFGVNVADVIPSSAVRAAIDAALAHYESAITGDAPDILMPASGLDATCNGNGGLFHGRTVDDVLVVMDIGPIDGPGNIAGQAGICGLVRGAAPFTITSQLRLDSDDLAGFSAAVLYALVWHEMGHGFGLAENAWTVLNLMTGANGSDPRYIGAAGVAQFQGTLGGSGNPAIEADGGEGTRDSHWDEGFFDREVMTGWLDSSNPISVLTVAALGDLGWTGIDLGAADAYTIPGCSPGCSAPPAPAPGVDTKIPLLDDVLREPLYVMDPDGTLRTVFPGGGSP